jgi:hypothetical protein
MLALEVLAITRAGRMVSVDGQSDAVSDFSGRRPIPAELVAGAQSSQTVRWCPADCSTVADHMAAAGSEGAGCVGAGGPHAKHCLQINH